MSELPIKPKVFGVWSARRQAYIAWVLPDMPESERFVKSFVAKSYVLARQRLFQSELRRAHSRKPEAGAP